jgi:hypothetical protein
LSAQAAFPDNRRKVMAAEKAARMSRFHRWESPKKEEKHQVALFGIISHLTAKCSGNIHQRCVVKITASSVSNTDYPWNAAQLGYYARTTKHKGHTEMQEILPYPFINGRHEDRHLSPKQEEIFH